MDRADPKDFFNVLRKKTNKDRPCVATIQRRPVFSCGHVMGPAGSRLPARPQREPFLPQEYSLGMRKLCSPWASSVTVPAGNKMTGLPSSSTSNSVVSSMVT